MTSFKRWNNIVGWAVFAIAAPAATAEAPQKKWWKRWL